MKMNVTGWWMSLALILLPTGVFAHGEPPAPSHGGRVQEAQELWLELVVKENSVTVYVVDQTRKSVPAAEVTGSATVLVSGKPYRVQLTAVENNRLEGKLPVHLQGKVVAVVALTVRGRTVTARFAAT